MVEEAINYKKNTTIVEIYISLQLQILVIFHFIKLYKHFKLKLVLKICRVNRNNLNK